MLLNLIIDHRLAIYMCMGTYILELVTGVSECVIRIVAVPHYCVCLGRAPTANSRAGGNLGNWGQGPNTIRS